MRTSDMTSNEKLLRAAALDSLVAELGGDFASFVTADEKAEMIEERMDYIKRRSGLALAA